MVHVYEYVFCADISITVNEVRTSKEVHVLKKRLSITLSYTFPLFKILFWL